jgi:integrase/recombinase XerD
MPGPEPRLHLPYAQWPPEDRLLWERAMQNDDPFGDTPGVRLAQATQHCYLFAWRRFLGFLLLDEPEALQIAPAERLTPERVRAFRAHLAETNIPISVAVIVDAVYKTARLLRPERDWIWLKAMKARLYRAAPSSARIKPVITSLQLLELGEQLMKESEPKPGALISTKDAIQYRDGLMIALLAFAPLRRKNVAALEIGRHLIREGDGWFVIISREETKTRRTPIEFPVPKLLEPYLAIYLDTVRPRLISHAACAALWLNSQGRRLAYAQIGDIISGHSMSRLGVRITPHDVRDAAATLWALLAPDQIGVASDLLTHADLTTLKHYNRARGMEASRAYAQIIAGMRRTKRTHRRGLAA